MDILIVSSTEMEIKPFLDVHPEANVLITGVGTPATIYHLTKMVYHKKFDLLIQVGIGGTFHHTDEMGNVYAIDKDAFADLGLLSGNNFQTLDEIGLSKNSAWMHNAFETDLPKASAVTVNKVTDREEDIHIIKQKFNADIESMEGAAFHYVCSQEKLPFIQLRSVSNVVGERDKSKWKIKEAIATLNTALIDIYESKLKK